MNTKGLIKNIFRVITGHGFKLVMGFAVGFLLPIILSIEDFGYYRLFALYLSYLGIFHLGFIDGIYLKYVGYTIDEIVKDGFGFLWKCFLVLESIFTVGLFILSIVFFKGERQIVFLFLSINPLPINITSLFQYISQITSRFKEFSNRNVIYSTLVSLSILAMYLFSLDNYIIYLILFTFVNYIVVIWYLFTYRELIRSKAPLARESIFRTINLIKLGAPLLITNFIVIFILNVPKQVIDYFYSIEVFAIFSFSFGMLSLISLFIGAIGTVMYPTLFSLSKKLLREYYQIFNAIISSVTALFLATFFAIDIIVTTYLIKYSESISILSIIFPLLLFSSTINIIKINYYKVLKKLKKFFIASFSTIVFTIISCLAAYMIFGTVHAVAYATLFSVAIWGFLLDLFLGNNVNQSIIKNNAFQVIIIIMFYLIININIGFFISFILYFFISVAVIGIFYGNDIYKFIKNIYKRKEF